MLLSCKPLPNRSATSPEVPRSAGRGRYRVPTATQAPERLARGGPGGSDGYSSGSRSSARKFKMTSSSDWLATSPPKMVALSGLGGSAKMVAGRDAA